MTEGETNGEVNSDEDTIEMCPHGVGIQHSKDLRGRCWCCSRITPNTDRLCDTCHKEDNILKGTQ